MSRRLKRLDLVDIHGEGQGGTSEMGRQEERNPVFQAWGNFTWFSLLKVCVCSVSALLLLLILGAVVVMLAVRLSRRG